MITTIEFKDKYGISDSKFKRMTQTVLSQSGLARADIIEDHKGGTSILLREDLFIAEYERLESVRKTRKTPTLPAQGIKPPTQPEVLEPMCIDEYPAVEVIEPDTSYALVSRGYNALAQSRNERQADNLNSLAQVVTAIESLIDAQLNSTQSNVSIQEHQVHEVKRVVTRLKAKAEVAQERAAYLEERSAMLEGEFKREQQAAVELAQLLRGLSS